MSDELTINQRFPIEDWRFEVVNGDTLLGFREWQQHRLAAEESDCEGV